MAVGVENPRDLYVGNGSTTVFPLNFSYTDASDVEVYLNGVLQGSGFSVNESEVAFNSAPASGVQIAMVRDTPLDQPVPFSDPQKTTVNEVERVHDRVVRQLQERESAIGRALRFGVSDSANGLIPSVAERALKVIRFDENGDIELVKELGNWVDAVWSTGTNYVKYDIFKASNSNVYFTVQGHTSTTLSADVAAGKIVLLVDVAAAQQILDDAEGEASAAAVSAQNAANSEAAVEAARVEVESNANQVAADAVTVAANRLAAETAQVNAESSAAIAESHAISASNSDLSTTNLRNETQGFRDEAEGFRDEAAYFRTLTQSDRETASIHRQGAETAASSVADGVALLDSAIKNALAPLGARTLDGESETIEFESIVFKPGTTLGLDVKFLAEFTGPMKFGLFCKRGQSNNGIYFFGTATGGSINFQKDLASDAFSPFTLPDGSPDPDASFSDIYNEARSFWVFQWEKLGDVIRVFRNGTLVGLADTSPITAAGLDEMELDTLGLTGGPPGPALEEYHALSVKDLHFFNTNLTDDQIEDLSRFGLNSFLSENQSLKYGGVLYESGLVPNPAEWSGLNVIPLTYNAGDGDEFRVVTDNGLGIHRIRIEFPYIWNIGDQADVSFEVRRPSSNTVVNGVAVGLQNSGEFSLGANSWQTVEVSGELVANAVEIYLLNNPPGGGSYSFDSAGLTDYLQFRNIRVVKRGARLAAPCDDIGFQIRNNYGLLPDLIVNSVRPQWSTTAREGSLRGRNLELVPFAFTSVNGDSSRRNIPVEAAPYLAVITNRGTSPIASGSSIGIFKSKIGLTGLGEYGTHTLQENLPQNESTSFSLDKTPFTDPNGEQGVLSIVSSNPDPVLLDVEIFFKLKD